MHARKAARDAYFPSRLDDAFFGVRGDVVFESTASARAFAQRVNLKDGRDPTHALRPAEVAAMALVHEIFHAVIGVFRKRNPGSFDRLLGSLEERLQHDRKGTLLAFLGHFPPPAIYGQSDTPQYLLAREGRKAEDEFTEEVLLLWLMNQNPAYEPVRPIITDRELPPSYWAFVAQTKTFFDKEPPIGPRGETLVELLLAPARHSTNIFDQLRFIEEVWGRHLGLDELGLLRRIAWARDFSSEEGKWFFRGGPGPGEPLLDAMRFGRADDEPMRFSEDRAWMPRAVMIAKSVYVWLDQLSKKHQRAIERLDQIPDEELDILASRGFNGLWLIGIFERSRASQRVKQMRGDGDALASAYSLMKYDIAEALGGHLAYANLRDRAWTRGIRLAADMVPNHVGIDAEWVVNHPDWFLRAPHPPFPSYRFGGPDLSEDPRVGVFIEEGYWSNTDAAVVFRRHDRWTDSDMFIYHGNDGTSMPWNDTAQLDYTKAEVRQAVIETILHVARMFPIIRFDAAMTLAKRHYRRLWFPPPGQGGAIPSRSDYAMTDEEFDRVFPIEFWREVVDTVAERAPDTLLLAEAFWMMEGYFVRTLGMHRVYNSAFMNMLKREENDKYRQTIKNVLEFDPRILERFVNFMNNPDEETAIAQFGSDDKYFGVATLMCTMPGLPMFGHGQIEGFTEKYGMEYRRAKWDERPNEGLVARHEREIFPLLRKRWLFAGVASFAFYDFVAERGGVDEDVFAYSNGFGQEKTLVVYNNKWKTTRGRVIASAPARQADGGMRTWRVDEALGLTGHGGFTIWRDVATDLEHIRPTAEIVGEGFFFELHAFKYHVLTSFRVVHATAERPYDKLDAELAGRGVPSIDRALVELHFRPVHAPLREAVAKGHADYLAKGWDAKTKRPTPEAEAALETRLTHVADGLRWMIGREVDAAPAIEKARRRYAEVLALVNAEPGDKRVIHRLDEPRPSPEAPEPSKSKKNGNGGSSSMMNLPKAPVESSLPLLLAWMHVEAVLDLLEANVPTDSRAALVDHWELAFPLVEAFGDGASAHDAKHRAALVLLAATLPRAPLRESMHAALLSDRGRVFLGVHDASGTTWLSKERWEELAGVLAERQALEGRASLALAHREAEDCARLAARGGYRVQAMLAELATTTPTPTTPTPPTGTSPAGTAPKKSSSPPTAKSAPKTPSEPPPKKRASTPPKRTR